MRLDLATIVVLLAALVLALVLGPVLAAIVLLLAVLILLVVSLPVLALLSPWLVIGGLIYLIR